ncbi:cation:proton antiporter [archaeon]|nr:cation:proton antiporter [archaeon]
MILMLFITGFQQGNIEELMKNGKAIITTSTLGYFLPFAVAMIIGYLFVGTTLFGSTGFEFNQEFSMLSFLLLISLAVASTDSGITIKSIMSVGKLNSKPGKIMLGVTVMDGIMGLVIFTAIMTYISLGKIDIVQILAVVFMITIFLLIFIVMQKYVPKVVHLVEHLSVEQAEFSFAFIFMILLAVIAEHFGLHGIIGAFLAGIILSKCPIATTSFVRKLTSISYGIFIPLFFVWTGLLLDFGNLIQPVQIWMAFALIGGVIIANSIAAYYSGKLSGVNEEDSLLMSLTMLPRGDINLVIASIAISMTKIGDTGELINIIPQDISNFIYSTVMILILFAAVVTFVLLKLATTFKYIKTGNKE